jgi:diguanylate cyclase (GGDEF)-like protein
MNPNHCSKLAFTVSERIASLRRTAGELLLRHAGAAVCVYDAEDRVLLWNERYVDFFPEVASIVREGLHFCETVEPFLRRQHPRADAAEIAAGIAAALDRHRRLEGPLRYQRGDDGRWLELRMFPQVDGGRIKVWTDVTAEQMPRSDDTGMLELLTVGHVGLIVHDADGRLLYTNARYFSEMFLHVLTALPDVRRRGVQGAYWSVFREMFHDDADYRALCARTDAGALAVPATLRARTGRWFRITEQAWRGGIASVWTDVTDLIERKEALKAAYADMLALNDQLRDRAETDSLTGLPNRRRFDAALSEAQARSDAGAAQVIGVVDVDHFKAVNDRFGHDVGDAVLIEVGRCLRQGLAPDDIVARLGGEEFGVVFAQGDGAEIVERAQALRRRVEALACDDGRGGLVRVTVSIGLAEMEAGEVVTDTLRRADLAMFQAKGLGRNRVRSA